MTNLKRFFMLISILVLLGSLVGCGGGGEEGPTEGDGPSGQELIQKMETALNATEKAHFTVEFQLATTGGGLRGTAEIWGERPGKMRIEAESDTPLLNGMVIGNNAESGWVYNPEENTLYIADYSLQNSQFGNQPELRAMLEFGDAIKSQGFSNTQATNLGAEEVNGRQTYKVETTYPAGGNGQVNLEGVKVTFWIDQETSLPHKVEVSVERGGVSGRGSITVQGDLNTTEAIAQDTFYYIPTGDGVQTVDLSNDLPRPEGALPVPGELNLK